MTEHKKLAKVNGLTSGGLSNSVRSNSIQLLPAVREKSAELRQSNPSFVVLIIITVHIVLLIIIMFVDLIIIIIFAIFIIITILVALKITIVC